MKIEQAIKRGFIAARARAYEVAREQIEDDSRFCGWTYSHYGVARELVSNDPLRVALSCEYAGSNVPYWAIVEGVRKSFDITGRHSKFGWKIAHFVAKCLTHGISYKTAIKFAKKYW